MKPSFRLLSVLAHPDDESLGMGGTLAKYAAEGVETYLLVATRGERGWQGDEKDNPGMEALGQIRENELRCASAQLGVCELYFLDYLDGELDQAVLQEVVIKIASYIRRIRPHIVITFDPLGAYGHPDHIAISQFTQAAVLVAAISTYPGLESQPAHLVSKLYYMIDTEPLIRAFTDLIGEIKIPVDGEIRQFRPYPNWAASARIDIRAYWCQTVEAVACHDTQVRQLLPQFKRLPDLYDASVWGYQTFYRAFSLVNRGRRQETDLFEGIRPEITG